ncbi:hypothetical protein OJF2_57620 [Aquisphaera giovannonii]|uniref:Helicase XPB/Ssl2 N-terminal domain-containing protein n=1 Tax=Aquisphaera giovannonii TaxID=406548 RepID=A0A5B9WAP6_9BACT|nr:hypothetical protein [Aquisphaera giovannonii]QEH37175.1 hypothetical protein OJF2_57620 [Aquisphaera giovannonii]
MSTLPGPRPEPPAPTPATPPSAPPGWAADAPAEPADARLAFRDALARLEPARLAATLQAAGLEPSRHAAGMASDWTSHLDSPRELAKLLSPLGHPARMVLTLFAMTDTTVWPLAGLRLALQCLGVEPAAAVRELLEPALAAIDGPLDPAGPASFPGHLDETSPPWLLIRIHPAAPGAVRVTLPEAPPRPLEEPVVQVRDADALEPVIRLGAIWQRVGAEPLRQTMQGVLYKRDLERVEGDAVLSGDVSDAPEPAPRLPILWLSLARRVGLIKEEDDRLTAAGAEFWPENAIHLPSMIATGWLGLRTWRESEPSPRTPDPGILLAYARPAVILWLAALAEDRWVALEDLAEHLRALAPGWDRTSTGAAGGDATAAPRRDAPPKRRIAGPGGRNGRGDQALRAILLGSGFAVGMIRVGEERGTGRTAVQLTPLGRYVLTLGPPPPASPTLEHFLFVQPNLEMIAYRQGLSPRLVGRLSQFAWWSKIGAALELKLTQESVVFGLETGLNAGRMIEILSSHSQRALPSLVPDAIGRWASHRDRVTYYAAATLLEFGSRQERDEASHSWNLDSPDTFLPVGDRFILVESAEKVPRDRISSRAARDYRLPPERCVAVEDDGITLAVDPNRSDLLVDAELRRIADEAPPPRGAGQGAALSRRYVVGAGSLLRAAELGLGADQIGDWFLGRTGSPPSPAIALLLRSITPGEGPATVRARRLLVLTTPTPEVADGLVQHPASRDLVGERIGPTSLVVAEEDLGRLRSAAESVGLRMLDD